MTNFMIAFLDCIVVSIPACHAGDRGSIPRLRAIKGVCSCPRFSVAVFAGCCVSLQVTVFLVLAAISRNASVLGPTIHHPSSDFHAAGKAFLIESIGVIACMQLHPISNPILQFCGVELLLCCSITWIFVHVS